MSHSKQSKENQEVTLATYERGVAAYASGTKSEVSGDLKKHLDMILESHPVSTSILEIGSATGRDADYIESKGYTIERTDAVEGFVKLQQENGHEAKKFNVLTDSLNRTFDLIIATAVFLHFDEEQFSIALENVKKHLTDGGAFVLAVKEGVGEEYSTHKMNAKRYFKYWKEDELRETLLSHGFVIEKIESFENNKWLVAFTKK